MKVNVGTVDRWIRMIAGAVLIGLAAAGAVGAWGYVGVVFLLTGFVRTCPAYLMLGLNSCSLNKP